MKKIIIIVLAILVMAFGAYGGVPGTTWNVDGANGHVGGGGGHGCLLCHAPHTNNPTSASGGSTYTGYSATAAPALYTSPGVLNPNYGADWAGQASGPATIAGAIVNGSLNNASIYLWAAALTPQTYTTWDSTHANNNTFTATGVTKADAKVHTLLCMSCHDNATGSHEMSSYANGNNPSGFINIATADGEAVGQSQYMYNGGSPAWGSASSLLKSHPVHTQYVGGGKYWLINTDGTFVDSTVGLLAYGHPAKLWADGSTTNYFVECTTCHDPHRETKTAIWNGSRYIVSTTANTIFYVRGPYADPGTAGTNGSQNADFCRSCHYDKTSIYVTSTIDH